MRFEIFYSGEENKQRYDNAADPADGPHQIQEGQIGHQGEYHIHPEETEGAHKDQCGDGRHQGSSHTPQSGGKHIVNTADKIGTGNQDHFLAGISNDRRFIGHNAG